MAASPAPAAKPANEEDEPVLPPPPKGMTITFRANQQGRLERVPEKRAGSTGSGTNPSVPSADALPTASGLNLSMEDCALPPQPSLWGLRSHTSAFADSLAKNIPSSSDEASPSLVNCLRRVIRASLMHKDVYREVASKGALTAEAVWLGVVLIIVSNIGLNIGNLFGYASTFFVKAMLLQAAGWAGAVFAVQFIAKSRQKLDLPPLAWMRAMIFSQSSLALNIVPTLGILAAGWSVFCMFAALMDVSGKDTKGAGLLFVTAVVANEIVVSVLRSVLL